MHDLPNLPYPAEALEPWLSRKAVRLHHEKLQAKYVHRLNQLTRNTSLAQVSMADIIRGLDPDQPNQTEAWRMAAQAWNHEFMWQSMRPNGGGRPKGILQQYLGSDREIREAFKQAVKDVFGTGWVWLMAAPDGVPRWWSAPDADNPMRYGYLPLLTCDVWEHAYYLDYPAERAEYADTFLDHLVNWDFATANYERAFR